MDIVKLKDHANYLPELARLHREEWGYLRPQESEGEHIACLSGMCTPQPIPLVLIAIEGGTLIGSAGIKTKDSLFPQIDLAPWLCGVYVKPASRSRGIAAMLIREIEGVETEGGFPSLHLCTNKHSRYYQRMGYETLQTREFCGDDVFVMGKSLR